MHGSNSQISAAEAIRRIFADRRSFTLTEAAQLIGYDRSDLAAQIAARELDSAYVTGGAVLPWSETAYLALRKWPLDVIFETLGDEAASCIPELLRPTRITVTLPTYHVRALDVLARDQQLDVSTYLQLHLLDLVSAESPFLAEEIPGFLAALHFPFGGGR